MLPSALTYPPQERELRANANGSRLRVASTSSLALDVFNGELVEVAGSHVAISAVAALSNGSNTIDANGDDAGVTPSASTTYGVFLGSPNAANFPNELRLGPTTLFKSSISGQRYLGTSGEAELYRCLGLVRLNASGQFVDSLTQRFLLNYDNQVARALFANPAYNNNNAQTTYSLNSANYAPVNAGSGDFVEFIADGYHAFDVSATFVLSATPIVVGGTFWGLGVNSTTAAVVAANLASAGVGTVGVRYVAVPSATYNKVSLLGASSGASTIVADLVRNGSAADVPATVLAGWLLG